MDISLSENSNQLEKIVIDNPETHHIFVDAPLIFSCVTSKIEWKKNTKKIESWFESVITGEKHTGEVDIIQQHIYLFTQIRSDHELVIMCHMEDIGM